ncbi:UNVERIFIED_CONTAM: hypothetical protein NCL1_14560 [Trichonephila clavipes]
MGLGKLVVTQRELGNQFVVDLYLKTGTCQPNIKSVGPLVQKDEYIYLQLFPTPLRVLGIRKVLSFLDTLIFILCCSLARLRIQLKLSVCLACKTVNIREEKMHLGHCMLFEFQKCNNAMEAKRNPCLVFGEEAVTTQ